MKIIQIPRYECEICKKQYNTEAEALHCEIVHRVIPKIKLLQDIGFIESYFGQQSLVFPELLKVEIGGKIFLYKHYAHITRE